jgi:hypothetical protein
VPELERHLPPARRESRDIGERFIYIAVSSMVALLLVCALATYWLYPQSRLDRTLQLPLPRYPAPQLQVSPSSDMQAYAQDQARRINERGASHIPIEEAMRTTARDGIPGWPQP